MSGVVLEAASEVAQAAGVRERLAAYMAQIAGGLARPEQRRSAAVYARGLLEAGGRKSLEPLVARLGEDGDYEALQHFLADSPWDPAVIQRSVAERVAPQVQVAAWVIDDTGVPKDGKFSPGVQRQYSGTLGKVGNCQIAVSLHAVGAAGTVPLGWQLYLPKAWCDDPQRRRRAKIPEHITFATKPEQAVDLIEQAARWEVPRGPVLGDEAYGCNSELRTNLHAGGLEYVLSINADAAVWPHDTTFTVPGRKPGAGGKAPVRPSADQATVSIVDLARVLPAQAFSERAYTTRDDRPVTSRFATVRVTCAHPVKRDQQDPRQEWLIIEWPDGKPAPTDYWISNLPADTAPERLTHLARLRWMIELDYRQLKGQLGLDHYEGRSWIGFHHHCAIVTAAHGFLTLERADPNHQRPA